MIGRVSLTISFCLVFVVASSGAEKTKVSVLIRGAHCDDCVKVIRRQLSQLKGVDVVAEDVKPGNSPRYFSPHVQVKVGDTLESGIGAVSKAVASAKTPHLGEVEPRLHLVLYTDFQIDESSVGKLRGSLQSVNGVLVEEPGGLGGSPPKRFYWIRLEPAGGADLKEILEAAQSALDVRLLEDETDS